MSKFHEESRPLYTLNLTKFINTRISFSKWLDVLNRKLGDCAKVLIRISREANSPVNENMA